MTPATCRWWKGGHDWKEVGITTRQSSSPINERWELHRASAVRLMVCAKCGQEDSRLYLPPHGVEPIGEYVVERQG